MHAEAVRVVYDPSKVSYQTLLNIFFSVVHDPTQLNMQGPITAAVSLGSVYHERQPKNGNRAVHQQSLGGKGVRPANRHEKYRR